MSLLKLLFGSDDADKKKSSKKKANLMMTRSLIGNSMIWNVLKLTNRNVDNTV